MKKLFITAVISLAVLSFNSHGAIDGQKTFKFVGDTKYASICEAAATDNVPLFNKSVKKQLSWMNIPKRKVLNVLLDSENFTCAGKGIVEFAQARGAQQLLNYITAENASPQDAKKFAFAGDTEYAGFCKAALRNNVQLFKRAVRSQIGNLASSKQEVLDIVLEADNVQCSGLGIVEFSEQRKATKVIEFISNARA
jgi:hypothetical protein